MSVLTNDDQQNNGGVQHKTN